jgi:hypothetical protein
MAAARHRLLSPVLILLAVASLGLSGCTSEDPGTWGLDVTITNDTSSKVVILQCESSCDPTALTNQIVLVPGGTTNQVTVPGTANPWLVKSGHKLSGCLTLYLPSNYQLNYAKFYISSAVSLSYCGFDVRRLS